MSQLIDAGVNVNQGDNDGDCAGHRAVRHGRVENLKFLLALLFCSQVDKQNNNGETMLLVAANKRNVEIVKVLIDAGVDLNVRSRKLISPLHEALERNVEIATLLLGQVHRSTALACTAGRRAMSLLNRNITQCSRCVSCLHSVPMCTPSMTMAGRWRMLPMRQRFRCCGRWV
jgi:hypothetical protein